MTGQGSLDLGGNLSSDVVNKKNTGWWKLKNTVKHAKMKAKGQISCCVGRAAHKSGPRLQVRDQAAVKRYLSKIYFPKTHCKVTRTA